MTSCCHLAPAWVPGPSVPDSTLTRVYGLIPLLVFGSIMATPVSIFFLERARPYLDQNLTGRVSTVASKRIAFVVSAVYFISASVLGSLFVIFLVFWPLFLIDGILGLAHLFNSLFSVMISRFCW